MAAREVAIERASGKLRAPDDQLEVAIASGFGWLSISAEHATVAGALPVHHRAPFDRMLVAQARVESLSLVTRDEGLEAFGIPQLAA